MKNRITQLALPHASDIEVYKPGIRCALNVGSFDLISSVEDASMYDNSQFELDILQKYGVLSNSPLVVAHHDGIAIQLQFEELICKSSNDLLNVEPNSIEK